MKRKPLGGGGRGHIYAQSIDNRPQKHLQIWQTSDVLLSVFTAPEMICNMQVDCRVSCLYDALREAKRGPDRFDARKNQPPRKEEQKS